MRSLQRIFKISGLFLMLSLGIGILVKWMYKIQLQSKIETLIQANQSMRHYQGMTFDLTGLGPFIVFNIERGDEFEVHHLSLKSGKDTFERTFNVGHLHSFNRIVFGMTHQDIDVSITLKLTGKSSLMVLTYTFVLVTIFCLAGLLLKLIMERKKSLELTSLAKQVAHDIRSPLEVLKVLKGEVKSLPDHSSHLLEMSIHRIEEIAFNLLKPDYKMNPEKIKNHVSSEEILSLLESLLLEKRIEYAAYDSVAFKHHFDSSSFGLFSQFSRSTLKRVISNLINNAFESLENKTGRVDLYLKSDGRWNIVEIKDSGIGMTKDQKLNLFRPGFTTKKQGSGLGLSSAFKEISLLGGILEIESEVGQGTKVAIKLPVKAPPKNFIKAINTYQYKKIILLDDDPGIHELWKLKLDASAYKIDSFFSAAQFLERYEELPEKTLLVCDYDLKDESINGVDIINRFNRKGDSLLSSARCEELSLREECNLYDIRFLSKNLISYIEIRSTPRLIVLIDDDRLIQTLWRDFYGKNKIPFRYYSTIDEFLIQDSDIPKDSLIFIDCNLKDGIRGEVASESLSKLGYSDLYLSTGHDKSEIKKPLWIKEVLSKEPPEF